ncbi:MAG: acetolactate decarboxylase [Armatimonadetes bacterium]|nr:acetolactate decarboxylase [Armatimonadota bacterium]
MSISLLSLALVSATTQAKASPEVKVWGALRPIIMEGKRDSKIILEKAGITPDTFGVGAVAELDGEITIVGGKIYLSRSRNRLCQLDSDQRAMKSGAAMVTISHVKKWQEVAVPQSLSWGEIDSWIDKKADELGLDTESRIPFQFVGKFSEVTAHIIDGKNIPAGPSSHEVHAKSGVQFNSKNEEGTVVGFFSKHDAGVITHHTTYTHMHIVIPQKEFAGHVDGLVVTAETKLLLPRY